MKSIYEGLQMGDLEDLVLSTISIDEFESKISKDAIVVAFFVNDEKPAYDLSNFIERGYTTILDADVSPAPNSDGYYLVFLEFIRNKDFIDKILEIVTNIEGLVKIKNWKCKVYKQENFIDLNKQNLEKYVRLIVEENREIAKEMLKNSLLESYSFDTNDLILKKNNIENKYRLLSCGNIDRILIKEKLYNKPFSIDETSISECRYLNRLLGENWNIAKIENKFLLLNENNVILISAN